MLSQEFLNWKQAQWKVNNCSKKKEEEEKANEETKTRKAYFLERRSCRWTVQYDVNEELHEKAGKCLVQRVNFEAERE